MIRANRFRRAADGTRLVHDLHLPAGDAPCTTVVLRTPYGRSKHLAEGRGWARRGFAFVVEDVRGRYDSDGRWRPYRGERADGAALLDAITAQPWSDGRVVLTGGSYAGYTAWAAAVERPEAVAAVVSLGPSLSLARTKFSPAGMLRLAEHAAWWSERGDARTSRDGLAALLFAEDPTVLDSLPVRAVGDRLGPELPGWWDVVEAGPHDATGEEITDAELAAVRSPSLHVGGWHDLLLPETLRHWHLVGDAATPKRLLVGPWLHDLVFSADGRVGAVDHGPGAAVAWADELVPWLRDALAGALPPRRADTFVMSGDGGRWRSDAAWPPPARPATLRLGSGVFRTDLGDPVPSRAEGADRRDLLARTDVLRLPLDAPAGELIGAPAVRFIASAPVPGADWIVRLLMVRPDGAAIELAVGETTTARTDATCALSLTPISIRPPTGARLLLEVAGSDVPRLARSAGPADRYAASTAELPAPFEQRVADLELVLPVALEEAAA